MVFSEKSQHVYSYDGGWYFEDEVSFEHGPYDTEDIALEKFKKYCHWLETGEDLK